MKKIVDPRVVSNFKCSNLYNHISNFPPINCSGKFFNDAKTKNDPTMKKINF